MHCYNKRTCYISGVNEWGELDFECSYLCKPDECFRVQTLRFNDILYPRDEKSIPITSTISIQDFVIRALDLYYTYMVGYINNLYNHRRIVSFMIISLVYMPAFNFALYCCTNPHKPTH